MIWTVRIVIGFVVLAVAGAVALRIAMGLVSDDPATAGPVAFDELDDRHASRSALAAPPDRREAVGADFDAPVFDADQEAVRRALVDVLQARPRSRVAVSGQGQILAVERSFLFRFPDEIAAQAVVVDGGTSLYLYSRSRFGRSDLGVNRERVESIIAAVTARLEN